jgi:hypothetical protein
MIACNRWVHDQISVSYRKRKAILASLKDGARGLLAKVGCAKSSPSEPVWSGLIGIKRRACQALCTRHPHRSEIRFV